MLNPHDTQRTRPWEVLTTLDPRSLCLMRVALGLTLLVDLSERLFLAPYFFTEDGILPHALWQTLFGHKSYYWSLHFFESAGMAYGVIGAQIVAAIALLLGRWPRLMALISWILLLSINLRNPMVTYGGDKLSPTLLLIAALLPLPSHKQSRSKAEASHLGAPTLALQMSVLYMAAGFSKAFESSWVAGTALRNALNMDLLVKPIGVWASHAEVFLQIPSVVTPYWEIILGALLLIPSLRGHIRTAAILGLLSLNLGIWLTMDVGYFMMYASSGLAGLLPTSFWQTLEHRFKAIHIPNLPAITPLTRRESHWGPSLMLQRTVAVWLMVIFSITFMEGLKAFPRLPWSSWLWTAVRAPNTYQNWDLFKNPGPTAQWYVTKAELNNGTVVDVLRDGGPVDYRRKRSRNDLFTDSFRWRLCFAKANKYWKHEETRDNIARNVARHWNDHQPSERRAHSIAVYKMTKKIFRDSPTTRHFKIFSDIPSI